MYINYTDHLSYIEQCTQILKIYDFYIKTQVKITGWLRYKWMEKNNDSPSQNIVNFWSFVELEHIDWFILIVFFLFSIKNFNLASQHYCDQSTWLSKNKMYMH